MARLLEHLSRFLKLEAIILVVYQRSAFNLTFAQPRHTVPWDHHDLCEAYHFRFNVNFNLENYWLRRPYQTKLVRYDPEAQKPEKPSVSARASKSCCREPQPRGHQVRDLKKMFEKSLQSVAEDGRCFPTGSYQPPKLETATLTWIYTGFGYSDFS
jgi:hypothetical protein